MTRARLTLAALLAAVLALAGCAGTPASSPPPVQPTVAVWQDEDTCIPDDDDPDGPWVEADDGEPCVQDLSGAWVEGADHDAHSHRKAGSARPATTKRTATTKRATRATTRARSTRRS